MVVLMIARGIGSRLGARNCQVQNGSSPSKQIFAPRGRRRRELRDMEGIWAKIAHDHVGRDPVVAFPRPGQRAFDRQVRSQSVSASQPKEDRRDAGGDRGD